ncbi:MAG TPA: hypothetical protein VE988_19645, partial [Gemmataceae bacterium]|nr:hypothetical protein [Gemmataceae bacterium]
MMPTILCLLVPIASLMLAGLVVRGVLARGKALDEAAWLQVPFIGVAVNVLILQFQLYLNIPVKRGVIALWAILLVFAGAWLLWGKVKDSFRQVPILPFAIAGLVLLIQSVGLIRVGPQDYAGRSWPDQFNYIVMAEYFRGTGFDVEYGTLGQQAWLARVPDLKNRRIGQSVLHAYHGVITRMDTRSQFMPTILLACPLIALALFAVGRRLGLASSQAALAGLFGGLAPGISLLVQESFLSHAYGIPLLFMLPVVLSIHNSDRSVTSLLTAVLFLGALASLYSEFLMMELAMVGAFFVLTLIQGSRQRRHCLSYLVLLAAPWLCNPLYTELTTILTIPYMTTPGLLSHVYPWAYDAVGFGVLWCGDKCVMPGVSESLEPLATAVGLTIAIGGALGLAALTLGGVRRWWRGER